jgi:internalin A
MAQNRPSCISGDFGGQDVYHGTHALFMRTRAAFVIVWTPESESSGEHVWEGMAFRNHPLPYWIDTVRHLGAPGSPVLIVQTRCDRLEDDVHRLPAPPELLVTLPHWELQYSALNDRKRASLDEALREAVERIRAVEGGTAIGAGRLKVKQRLEQLRDADAKVPPEQRQYRTITQEHFRQLCEEARGIGAPEHLLSYLHNAGIVFYRQGLFDDRIILDQAWALEAIYAVFNRETCYRPLRHLRGRFTRAILGAFAWREYSTGEREVFLGMMQSCGICFVHRHSTLDPDGYKEYIAPDLLPERAEIQPELDMMWDEEVAVETSEFEYALLHPGMVRSVISRIGSEAGVTALYWRGGLCLYEMTTRSRALIEQEMADEWRGKIVIRTQRGQALELLRRLSALARDESARMGAQPITTLPIDRSLRPSEFSSARQEPAGLEPTLPLQFNQERGAEPQYFVSYAWGDLSPEGHQREAIVDRLCEAAEQRGLVILRDKRVLRLGDSITKFMQSSAGGDRVFVILSGKYLQSPYCMYELLEIWRKCSGEEEKFLDRIRVYIISGTKIFSVSDRAQYAIYWREEYEKVHKLIRDHGPDVVGRRGFQEYKLMGDFRRWVAEILEAVADRLQPRDFEDLAKYGLDDLVPRA